MSTTVTSRLDGLVASLANKAPCLLKTTANHALSGLASIDGVTPPAGARILVGSQTTASQNGIYVAASGAWARALDFDGTYDAVGGTQVFVILGATNSNSYWKVDGNSEVVIGTDAITFSAALVDDSATSVFTQAGTGAVARTAQNKMREIVTPADFKSDSDPDDTVSIQRALAASLNVMFSGDYTVSGTGPLFNIRTGHRLWGKANIAHSTPDQITFNAVDVNEWSIDGIKVTGSGNSLGTAAALYVSGCNKWRATNFIAKSINGWGIKIDPGTHVAPYSDQGVLTGCSAHDCYYGVEGTPGTGAEYVIFIGWVTTGCGFGTVVEAGNWQFFGGSDTENTDGFTLLGGSNNAHGQAVARNFSHNTGENVKVNGATNGFTFVACHSYANDATHGYITLIDTKDINWLGGKIDAPIRASGTTTSCTFSKITFPGTLTAITGTAASAVRVDDCRTLNAAQSALNTPSPIYVEATRTSSTQDVSAGATTLIFNNEVSDIGAGYDNTTGVFTAPWACVVELDAMLEVTAASGLVDSYIAVDYNSGTTIGYIPMIAISGTVMLGSGVVKVTLAAGDTLRLKSTITGTTPVLAITQSRISITQIS